MLFMLNDQIKALLLPVDDEISGLGSFKPTKPLLEMKKYNQTEIIDHTSSILEI